MGRRYALRDDQWDKMQAHQFDEAWISVCVRLESMIRFVL